MQIGQEVAVSPTSGSRRKAADVGRWGGGDEGTRTPDPRDANAVLSQLSYIPNGPAQMAGGEYSKGLEGFPK
jgi:hypothetical protein